MKPRILVVDNDEGMLEVLHRHLEQEGWEVTAVTSGAAARAALERRDVDVILTDLVMEDVDGRNRRQVLSQCAARRIVLPVDFAAYLAHVVAQALDCAHGFRDFDGNPLPLVHCDLSPSNVFISRIGEVKLGDFGVARFLAGEGGKGRAAYGKVRYLAPEQIRGEGVTPRTDLFALGAVFFELLTGQHAFPGSDPDQVGQRILRGELRSPAELRPDVPHTLVALCLRCMAALPAERVSSAAAFAREIDRVYDHSIGTPLAIASVVQGLFGAADG